MILFKSSLCCYREHFFIVLYVFMYFVTKKDGCSSVLCFYSLYYQFSEHLFSIMLSSVEMRPCVNIVAFFSGDNMYMEMTDGLSCAFSAGIEQIDALVAAAVHKMP